MADQIIDIERRLELAAQELLKKWALLTALVPATEIFIQRDASHAVKYPCVTVQAINFAEFGLHSGWYRGPLQLSALTYREDDKTRGTLKQVLGALRAWAQQTDLESQLNGTAIAKAAATALDTEDASLEGAAFDSSEDKKQEETLTLACLVRPTQATTT